MFICLFVCISFLLTLEEQSVGSVVLFGLVGFKIRYLVGRGGGAVYHSFVLTGLTKFHILLLSVQLYFTQIALFPT